MIKGEISGKIISNKIYTKIRSELSELKKKSGEVPKLLILMASDDEGSSLWITKKQQIAEDLGFDSEILLISPDTGVAEIESIVEDMNLSTEIQGILVQLPLFKHLEPYKSQILSLVNPLKDIDGLTPLNQGMINFGLPSYISATAQAVYESINLAINGEGAYIPFSEVNLKGINVTIVNHSVLIGRPLAQILLNSGATVTVCHEYSKNIKSFMLNSDIVISATGNVGIWEDTSIKKDSIVIDVTSMKTEKGFRGDFLLDDNLFEKALSWTPVPGGIGPVTIACLMNNLLEASKVQLYDK